MSNGIELEGFEEITEFLQDMTIDEADEKKVMKVAIETIYNEVYKNAPEHTRKLKKDIKKQVKKEELAIVGIIKLGAWYSMFNEFGTSQSKKHVGFFERSVEKSKNEAIEVLAKELLDKAK